MVGNCSTTAKLVFAHFKNKHSAVVMGSCMFCVKSNVSTQLSWGKKIILMSNMCIHVAGVSMSSSGNLPSSTPLKESSKLINNNTSILLVKSVTFNLYLLRASMALVLFFDCAYIRHLCQSIRPSGTFVQIYLKYWFGIAYRERFLHLYNAIQLQRVSSLTP